jgi:hypothetical protein
MIPATVNLFDHYRGDTWDGMTIGPVMFNTGTAVAPVLVPPTYPVASCRMQFRSGGTLGYELTNVVTAGKGLVTVTDATAWTFAVLPQLLPLDAGEWLWDFECTDTQGAIMTLYKGQINVVPDQSQ